MHFCSPKVPLRPSSSPTLLFPLTRTQRKDATIPTPSIKNIYLYDLKKLLKVPFTHSAHVDFGIPHTSKTCTKKKGCCCCKQ